MNQALSHRTSGVSRPVRWMLGASLSLIAMMLITACGGSNDQTAPTLNSISVTPTTMSVAAGVTDQFAATAMYSDGSKHDVSGSVTWTSSNLQVATMNASGLASSRAAGSTTITATLSGVSGSAMLTVTTATLVSIGVTPAQPSLAAGSRLQFTATGVYTDNSTHDLTTSVTWKSVNIAVASISNSTGSYGLATTLVPGDTAVTAALNGITSPAVTLTVTPATLVSIAVTPGNPNIASGTTEQFVATGTYTDHSTQNLTSAVTWASSKTTVATLSNSAGTIGLATSLSAGSTSVTATLTGVTSAAVTLTVSPATLVSIAVTPANPSIAAGTTEQFTATGTYTDHSIQNLTNAATWSSSNTAVASISNAAGSSGRATTLTQGATSVTATLNSVSSPAVSLTVTPATLVSIAVSPASGSIAAGTRQQFTAMGTFSDNTTQDLTTFVTWTSLNTGVASISNANGSQGLATAAASGSTTISATSGVISGNTSLAVTAATLVSIAITPTGPTIPAAATEQFVATGTYTDNSTQVLTTSVTWMSSNSNIASISNATNSNGLATGLGVGSSSISATFGSVNSPTVTLTVSAQSESILYAFAGNPDGASPQSTVIQASDGNFYGTTRGGGTNGSGTVFRITPTGVETVIYSFAGGADGARPTAGLVQGADGNFYGTTMMGGSAGYGTVFKVTSAGVETVLHTFVGGSGDGNSPIAGLIQASDGNFYGTTTNGGPSNAGVVYKITPAGVETPLYFFTGSTDGGDPWGGVIQGTDGNFYGTTEAGGIGYGTLFKMNPTGSETVIYSFAGGTDGEYPQSVIQGSDGNFYGVTSFGGSHNDGTIYRVTTNGSEAILHSFSGASDGSNPNVYLIQGYDGNLYGTTQTGGADNVGTIFKATPSGAVTVIHTFTSGLDGSVPASGLTQASDGNFYGTTTGGGASGLGVIFEF